jgi:hypothetical protein
MGLPYLQQHFYKACWILRIKTQHSNEGSEISLGASVVECVEWGMVQSDTGILIIVDVCQKDTLIFNRFHEHITNC